MYGAFWMHLTFLECGGKKIFKLSNFFKLQFWSLFNLLFIVLGLLFFFTILVSNFIKSTIFHAFIFLYFIIKLFLEGITILDLKFN